MIQRFWCTVVFLQLTAEYPFLYERHWSTPWHYIGDFLMDAMPIVHITRMDAIILVLLLIGVGQPGALRGRAKPLATALWVCFGTLIAWAVYGAIRGGSVVNMRLQLHIAVMLIVATFMQLAILRTTAHYRMLGKAILYAGAFRFVTMLIFYVFIMRDLTVPMETVTDHGDTILFVTCIVIMLANALHQRTRKAVWQALFFIAAMLFCIQINNRRLAWMSMAGSLLTMYFLLKTGPVRRIINKCIRYAVPIVALYTAVGWSHPTGVFKPLASFQSVNDPNNPSTRSRVMENMGLVITLSGNPLIGTGFGHQYIEVSDLFNVARFFPEYRYNPHNSVLGLVAFTGALGFTGIWMIFPVTVFLGARAYGFARTPTEQTIAVVTVCEVIIHVNQLWGDLGILANQGLVIMSGAMAAASRLAVMNGAWPAGRANRQNRAGSARTMSTSETVSENRSPAV